MKKYIFYTLLLINVSYLYGQVGIGTEMPRATLEISNGTSGGVLIPQYALSGNNDVTTVINPQTGALVDGTLVYNIIAVTGVNALAKGMVYWDGPTSTWIPVSGNASGWELTGNSINNNNFLGTTNAQSLQFRVNNNQVGLFHIDGGITFGETAISNNTNGIAIGINAQALGVSAITVGGNGEAAGQSIAIGNGSEANGLNTISIGNSNAVEENSIAVGQSSEAQGVNGSAFGFRANSSGLNSTAIGRSTDAAGTSSGAFGHLALASGMESTALGFSSEATAQGSIAIGDGLAIELNSIAIGNGSEAEGLDTISIGDSNAVEENSIAIGNASETQGLNGVALGFGANASGTNSIAIGRSTDAAGTNSVALGFDSEAPNMATIILGNNDTNASNPSATRVGIGTSNPTAKLQVDGSIRYVDGNQAAGRVLTSDVNGNATWQAIPIPPIAPPSAPIASPNLLCAQVYSSSTFLGLTTTSPIIFGTTSLNNGFNISNNNIQTNLITGMYKITYTLNLEHKG